MMLHMLSCPICSYIQFLFSSGLACAMTLPSNSNHFMRALKSASIRVLARAGALQIAFLPINTSPWDRDRRSAEETMQLGSFVGLSESRVTLHPLVNHHFYHFVFLFCRAFCPFIILHPKQQPEPPQSTAPNTLAKARLRPRR